MLSGILIQWIFASGFTHRLRGVLRHGHKRLDPVRKFVSVHRESNLVHAIESYPTKGECCPTLLFKHFLETNHLWTTEKETNHWLSQRQSIACPRSTALHPCEYGSNSLCDHLSGRYFESSCSACHRTRRWYLAQLQLCIGHRSDAETNHPAHSEQPAPQTADSCRWSYRLPQSSGAHDCTSRCDTHHCSHGQLWKTRT